MVRPVDRVLKVVMAFAAATPATAFPWSDPWIGY